MKGKIGENERTMMWEMDSGGLCVFDKPRRTGSEGGAKVDLDTKRSLDTLVIEEA